MTFEYQDLIGKPFKDLGRGPDGYDCWGVVKEVADRLGNDVPDYGVHYDDYESVLSTYKAVRNDYVPISKKDKLIPGDIVIYKRLGSGLHFGIMVDQHHFLHASEGSGVQKNRIDHPVVFQLVEGIYRCKTHTQ